MPCLSVVRHRRLKLVRSRNILHGMHNDREHPDLISRRQRPSGHVVSNCLISLPLNLVTILSGWEAVSGSLKRTLSERVPTTSRMAVGGGSGQSASEANSDAVKSRGWERRCRAPCRVNEKRGWKF